MMKEKVNRLKLIEIKKAVLSKTGDYLTQAKTCYPIQDHVDSLVKVIELVDMTIENEIKTIKMMKKMNLSYEETSHRNYSGSPGLISSKGSSPNKSFTKASSRFNKGNN